MKAEETIQIDPHDRLVSEIARDSAFVEALRACMDKMSVLHRHPKRGSTPEWVSGYRQACWDLWDVFHEEAGRSQQIVEEWPMKQIMARKKEEESSRC